jgi:acyl dehydratase
LGNIRLELEPISFDDLPLGGEWTTRRRTISESEIALFAAVAGDFSPLTVDTSGGDARLAPPAMLIALAVGLGSMDMPIPYIATWEWVSWKFPKPVHAGETVFARWTLTQKRPPVHGAKTGIAVWRVDVHTADGAMCAEGEIGAAIVRRAGTQPSAEKPTADAAAVQRRRRRRRGSSGQPEAAATPSIPTPAPTPPPAPAAERPPSRRRRRGKRGGGSASGNGNGGAVHAVPAPAAADPVSEPAPALAARAPAGSAQPAALEGTLTRVMRRLRRTQ